MSIVVDVSVLVATLVETRHESRWVRATLAEGPLAAPEYVLAETANVLRRYELSGRISRAEAAVALRELLRYDIKEFIRSLI